MYENLAPPPLIEEPAEIVLSDLLAQNTKPFVVMTPAMEMLMRFLSMRQEALARGHSYDGNTVIQAPWFSGPLTEMPRDIPISPQDSQTDDYDDLLDEFVAGQVDLALEIQERACQSGDFSRRAVDFLDDPEDESLSERRRMIAERCRERLGSLSLQIEVSGTEISGDDTTIAVSA